MPRHNSSRFMRAVVDVLRQASWLRRKEPGSAREWTRDWTAVDLTPVSSRVVDDKTDYSFILAVINALGYYASRRNTRIVINHVLRGDQPSSGNLLISRHHIGLAVDFRTLTGGTVMRQALVDDLRREGFVINFMKHYATFTHIDFAAADNLVAQYQSHLR